MTQSSTETTQGISVEIQSATETTPGVLVLRQHGPHRLISYGDLYSVDYATNSVGTSLFATEELEGAEAFYENAIKSYNSPIKQLREIVASDQVHRYDLWDSFDGQQAYLLSDCPPEQFDKLEQEFKETIPPREEGFDADDLIQFIESRDFVVVPIPRPINGINLND